MKLKNLFWNKFSNPGIKILVGVTLGVRIGKTTDLILATGKSKLSIFEKI